MKYGTRVVIAGTIMLASCALGSGCSSDSSVDVEAIKPRVVSEARCPNEICQR